MDREFVMDRDASPARREGGCYVSAAPAAREVMVTDYDGTR